MALDAMSAVPKRQAGAKRCGHRPGQEIVSTGEMVDRVQAAADAKTDPEFFLIARTDAVASHGVDAAIERAIACVDMGADGTFAEAAYDLPTYRRFADTVKVPALANIAEFGQTPLFTVAQLASAKVAMVLYPLSAFRAMNKAAENVYQAIPRDGTQSAVLHTLQTREALYDRMGYYAFEQQLDILFPAKAVEK